MTKDKIDALIEHINRQLLAKFPDVSKRALVKRAS